MNDPRERSGVLRLASFDGGGVRGVSQLEIMAHVMNRLVFDDTEGHELMPCGFFDLMGAAGTGGLLAVLLARLGLPIEQAIKELIQISLNIQEKPEEGNAELKVHIDRLLEKYHVDEEHTGDMYMLHNFDPCQEEATNLTTADAKLATLGTSALSASTPVFKNAPSPEKERFIPSCFRHTTESSFHSVVARVLKYLSRTSGKTERDPQKFKWSMRSKAFDRLSRAGIFYNRHLKMKPYECQGECCSVNVNFQPHEHAPNGDPDPAKLSGHIVIPDYQLFKFGRASLVYPGVWRGKPVAVKVLKAQKSSTKAANWENGVREEIKSVTCAWTSLKHPNLIPFYGHSEDFGDFGAFISPWYERGTAQHYLATMNPAHHERVRLTLDVCHGVRYLHEASIIHGDLKPMNVLIDDDGVGRVCDFGLSELVYYQELCDLTRTTVYDGPERYLAPEIFASADHRPLKLTFQGDIYSLGCITLQFIEGLCPFQRASSNREVIEAILSGLPPALRSESSSGAMEDALWTLLEACWGEALSRPTITTIVEIVGHLEDAGCADGL